MDLKKEKKDIKHSLMNRVLVCRSKLQNIGVKKPMDKFAIKYTEFAVNEKQIARLNNLWYGRITDRKFTEKLESFVSYKENEY